VAELGVVLTNEDRVIHAMCSGLILEFTGNSYEYEKQKGFWPIALSTLVGFVVGITKISGN
jgi:hypothetical protein